METQDNQIPEIGNLLRELGIRTVAIIDDAFDPPKPSVLTYETLTELLQNDEARDILVRVTGIEELDPDVLNQREHLLRLWGFAIDENSENHNALKQLFFEQLERREPLIYMAKMLRELDVTVHELTTDEGASLHEADVWFFDLFWDTDLEAAESWKISAGIAQQQFAKCHMEPPLFFLMSSDTERLAQLAEEFREMAKCPAGYFKTFDKRHLNEVDDEPTFIAWLKSSLDEKKVRFRRAVAGLTRAMANAAEGALERYRATLMQLAAEDYAHIYRFALKDEGAPLGSYMLWLFEPLFENYLRTDKDVHECRKNLDGLQESDIPWFDMAEQDPSSHLAEVHRARLWEKIPLERPSRLYQGELLTGHGEKWLVLNANCDLAYSEVSASRAQKEISLLLLPGQICEFSLAGNRTEFYRESDNGRLETVHIVWDFKNAVTVKYKDYNQHYTRVGWRLRSPHISEIVQEWSHQVTRFGTLVSPPIVRRLGVVELRWRANQNVDWYTHAMTVDHAAFAFVGKTVQEIKFVDMDKLAEEIQTAVGDGVPKAQLGSQLVALRSKGGAGLSLKSLKRNCIQVSKTVGVSLGRPSEHPTDYLMLVVIDPFTTEATPHD